VNALKGGTAEFVNLKAQPRYRNKEELSMSWEMESITHPVARKDYRCQAAEWIDRVGLREEDYDPADLESINKAREEGWKILKGTAYIKVRGKWDGEFCTFRARPELNDICQEYDIYSD